jgi:hypothetical protein
MKQLLFIIILIFGMPHCAHAEIPVKLTFGGEIGLGSDLYSYNSFCDIRASINVYVWKCKFTLYGSNLCWMRMDWNEPAGYPFREIYLYGGRFEISGFFIDYQHFCNHAVRSMQIHENNGEPNQNWYNNFWGESITTVKVGYEFEFIIWKNN